LSHSYASRSWNGAPSSVTERLANRLKELRTARGLTQAELAALVGVTRKSVNTIENGVYSPSALLAVKLAAALQVSVEEAFWVES
jgi:putative transcriptional regulator